MFSAIQDILLREKCLKFFSRCIIFSILFRCFAIISFCKMEKYRSRNIVVIFSKIFEKFRACSSFCYYFKIEKLDKYYLRKILGKISSTTISDELYSPNTKIVGNFSKIFIQIFDSAERILFESRIIEWYVKLFRIIRIKLIYFWLIFPFIILFKSKKPIIPTKARIIFVYKNIKRYPLIPATREKRITHHVCFVFRPW